MESESIQIRPGKAGRLIVLLPYTPECVDKIKTVAGRRWHQEERCWTVLHTDGTLRQLLTLFANEPVELEPCLPPVQGRDDRPLPPAVSHSKLLDRLRDAWRSRHYSRRTELSKVPLAEHLKRVRSIHQCDRQDGWGRVPLPDALNRKYPNATADWRWQYVFPSDHRWVNG